MFKAAMILPLVFLVFRLQQCNSLSCFPCPAAIDCRSAPKPSDCPSRQLTRNAIPCNCCRECAKAEGQECGGLWDSSGQCADNLDCVGEDTENHPGVCRYKNKVSPPVFPPLPPSDLTNRVSRNRKLILNPSCGHEAWILVRRSECPVAFTDPNFRRLRDVCDNQGNWADILDNQSPSPVKSMAVWRGHRNTMGFCDKAPVCLACPALNYDCPSRPSKLEACVEQCKTEMCYSDDDTKDGCNQMFNCPQACMMRHLGLSENRCRSRCERNGQSGCSPTVKGFRFNLCGPCNRWGCPTWPTVRECQASCAFY